MLRCQYVCPPQKSKASVFKFLWFEERFSGKLRFGDGLVWTVGLTVEIKVRFQISSAYCEQGFGVIGALDQVPALQTPPRI